MSNTADVNAQVLSLPTPEIRSLMGKMLSELRKRASGSKPLPSPSSSPTQISQAKSPSVCTAQTDVPKQDKPWGLVSNVGKTLKRRFATKAEADAAIPALHAATKLTYNASLIA